MRSTVQTNCGNKLYDCTTGSGEQTAKVCTCNAHRFSNSGDRRGKRMPQKPKVKVTEPRCFTRKCTRRKWTRNSKRDLAKYANDRYIMPRYFSAYTLRHYSWSIPFTNPGRYRTQPQRSKRLWQSHALLRVAAMWAVYGHIVFSAQTFFLHPTFWQKFGPINSFAGI